jgi:cell division septal protein FtsQ
MKIVKLSKLLVALIVLGLIIFGTVNLLKISKIEITKNTCFDSLEDMGIKGKFIFQVKGNELEQKIKDEFPCAKKAVVEKKLPNKLTVAVETFEDVARLEDTNLSITQNGELTEGVREGVPKVYLLNKEELKTANKITDPVSLFAVNIASLITKTDFGALTIRVLSPTEIVAYQKDETVAIFTSQKSAESQVDSLQQVTSLAKIDHDKIAKVDLRFDNPIIVEK